MQILFPRALPRKRRVMQVAEGFNAAIVAKWTNAQNWRELLHPNARFIRSEDPIASYPDPYGLQLCDAIKLATLDLQSYGFLVRYAQAEFDSGSVHNGLPAPNGPWVRTQDRAMLHLVLPTEAGISRPRTGEFLRTLLSKQEDLEVAVLADWKDYAKFLDAIYPYHE
ncbi:hypothetical protein BU25DRAFT_83490 [Macroventuria anomochaeta]|uniref:Uncharacterized protein n=1 Tax=Macroventuria anomochaeta TaxID=301207 RepID=A0ACB6SFN6_9PLEO|nr:uncharacterized protein BU25DRAFT_83490 [Macroventuria anomochaeta]KAF2632808.1 hypothetical protein BU25DRAFT_83490 [Macroventuria anomochaeta]